MKRIKQIIKNNFPWFAAYSRIFVNFVFFIFSKKNHKFCSNYSGMPVVLKEYKNTFFGYFDKSCMNPSNANLIIFHANNQSAFKKPSPKTITDLILYDLEQQKIVKIIDSVTSWNWQQGARLHWISKTSVIYNSYDEKKQKYIAKIYDVNHNQYQYFFYPVQDSYQNFFYLSLSYEVLRNTRPDYGYFCKVKKPINNYTSEISLINLKTEKKKVLIKPENVLTLLNISHENLKKIRFNHLLISPNGESFIGLFRYELNKIEYHQFFQYNLKKEILTILMKNQMISHYCWLDNENIVFWGVIDGQSDYFMMNVNSKETKQLMTNLKDGHPSLVNESTFITDTYPDKSRLRRLLMIHNKSGKHSIIAESFESPFLYGQCRCDLHPNYNIFHKKVHFDTICSNRRQLYILDLGRKNEN